MKPSNMPSIRLCLIGAGIASAATLHPRDTVLSTDSRDPTYNAQFGTSGQYTTVNDNVTRWLSGGSTHNFYGNVNNNGKITISQTDWLVNNPNAGGQTANFVGHNTANGNLVNSAGALISLNDFGSQSAPTYDWYLRTFQNYGTMQFCGRGDTGGSTYQLYCDIDCHNYGLIDFNQYYRNLGASFVWRNAALTAAPNNGGVNIYNEGTFRLINVAFHNVQNVLGSGCWVIGKGATLYLEDGSGVYQNPSKGPTFPNQQIYFADNTGTLHMDTQVYSDNPNFGPQVYNFGVGDAIEFYETIKASLYDGGTGIMTVTFNSNYKVFIKLGLGYTSTEFRVGRHPQPYNSAGYNAIFYNDATPIQTLPRKCLPAGAICSDPEATAGSAATTTRSTASATTSAKATTSAATSTTSAAAATITSSSTRIVTTTSSSATITTAVVTPPSSTTHSTTASTTSSKTTPSTTASTTAGTTSTTSSRTTTSSANSVTTTTPSSTTTSTMSSRSSSSITASTTTSLRTTSMTTLSTTASTLASTTTPKSTTSTTAAVTTPSTTHSTTASTTSSTTTSTTRSTTASTTPSTTPGTTPSTTRSTTVSTTSSTTASTTHSTTASTTHSSMPGTTPSTPTTTISSRTTLSTSVSTMVSTTHTTTTASTTPSTIQSTTSLKTTSTTSTSVAASTTVSTSSVKSTASTTSAAAATTASTTISTTLSRTTTSTTATMTSPSTTTRPTASTTILGTILSTTASTARSSSLSSSSSVSSLSTSPSSSTLTTSAKSSTVSTTSSTSAGPTPIAGTCAYTGCYTDLVSDRTLVGGYQPSGSMTVEVCQAFCQAKYKYFGLEYGSECFCSNTIGGTGAVRPDSECTFGCAGNSAEMCGGVNRLSLYTCSGDNSTNGSSSSTSSLTSTTYKASSTTSLLITSSVPVTATSRSSPSSSPSSSSTSSLIPIPSDGSCSRLGCYTDTVSSRTLQGSFYAGAMTKELCQTSCTGYTYFGLEYGRECFCGNKILSPGTLIADSDCSEPCAGDATETCGNSNRLDIYVCGSGAGTSTTSGGISTTTNSITSTATTTSGACFVSTVTVTVTRIA